MAGALQRLVARATGSSSTGLHPRVPAFFGTHAAQSGFEDISQDIPAPAMETTHPAQPTASMRETSVEHEPSAAVLKQPAQATSAPAQPLRQPPPAQQPPGQAAQRVARQPQPEPLLNERPLATGKTAPDPSAPVRPTQTLGHEPTADAVRADVRAPDLDPPPPLLQMAAQHRNDPADAAASTIPPPAPFASLSSQHTESAQPEITIHIGQLDIRSEQPAPIAPQRPAPATRNVPSLSDYLRGRG